MAKIIFEVSDDMANGINKIEPGSIANSMVLRNVKAGNIILNSATQGEALETMVNTVFPNWKIEKITSFGHSRYDIIIDSYNCFHLYEDWWNAPLKKEGNVDGKGID